MKIFTPSITGSLGVLGNTTLNGTVAITSTASISSSLLLNDNPNSNVAGINIGVIGQTANTTPGNSSAPGVVVGYGNVGNFNRSYVLGRVNTLSFLANGDDNITIGTSNTLSGNQTSRNIIIGNSNNFDNINGVSNVLLGESHQTSGSAVSTINYAGALAGFNNTIAHNRSVVVGGQNIATSAADTVFVPNLNVSGSAVVRAGEVLTLVPINPLPTGVATGSFAVSASVPPIPYFYNGTTWNALY
jgi:hypothetical protein